MIPEKLQQIELELRRAAAARLYDDVRRLATEFCTLAAAYAGTLPQGGPEAESAHKRVEEVLGWAILMMQLARSACLTDLQRLKSARRFLDGAVYHPYSPPHSGLRT